MGNLSIFHNILSLPHLPPNSRIIGAQQIQISIVQWYHKNCSIPTWVTALTVVHGKFHIEVAHTTEVSLKYYLHAEMFGGFLLDIEQDRMAKAAIHPF